MRKGISLSELAAKIERNQSLKMDFVADTSSMWMKAQPMDAEGFQAGTELQVGSHGTFPVNSLAHGQIAGRLKIPLPYYRRMEKEQRE